MMVNKFTTTNKTNNQLSPRTIEHQNDHEIWRWKSRSKNVVENGVVSLTWNFVLIGQNIIQNNTIAHSVLYPSIICRTHIDASETCRICGTGTANPSYHSAILWGSVAQLLVFCAVLRR
jgi:hypothetical protein